MSEKSKPRGFNMGVFKYEEIAGFCCPWPNTPEELHWRIMGVMAYIGKSVILKSEGGNTVEIVKYTPKEPEDGSFAAYYALGGYYTSNNGVELTANDLFEKYWIREVGNIKTKSIHSAGGQMLKISVYSAPSKNYGFNDSWKAYVDYMSNKGTEIAVNALDQLAKLFPGHTTYGHHDYRYERELTVWLDDYYLVDKFGSVSGFEVTTKKGQRKSLGRTPSFTITSVQIGFDQGWV